MKRSAKLEKLVTERRDVVAALSLCREAGVTPNLYQEWHTRATELERFGNEVIKGGWAGILPTGEIVDRREHPKASVMQRNNFLGIPEPQYLPEQEGGK